MHQIANKHAVKEVIEYLICRQNIINIREQWRRCKIVLIKTHILAHQQEDNVEVLVEFKINEIKNNMFLLRITPSREPLIIYFLLTFARIDSNLHKYNLACITEQSPCAQTNVW